MLSNISIPFIIDVIDFRLNNSEQHFHRCRLAFTTQLSLLAGKKSIELKVINLFANDYLPFLSIAEII